jgi:hypothetical protein
VTVVESQSIYIHNQTRSSIPAGVPIAMLVYSTFIP